MNLLNYYALIKTIHIKLITAINSEYIDIFVHKFNLSLFKLQSKHKNQIINANDDEINAPNNAQIKIPISYFLLI